MNPIRRIVVASDFSPTADKALDTAIAVAKRFDATLDIIHVLEPLLSAYPIAERPAVDVAIDRLLTERSERARAKGVVAQTTSVDGHAAAEIVAHARKTGSDLIVMGTHGLTGLAHAVVGSVAERVVHRSGCPVLVVPSRE